MKSVWRIRTDIDMLGLIAVTIYIVALAALTWVFALSEATVVIIVLLTLVVLQHRDTRRWMRIAREWEEAHVRLQCRLIDNEQDQPPDR